MFCNFCEKFENSKWPPFLARQKFFENWENYSFVFCNFCENFENSKWPPFWGRQKFFQNWDNYSAEIPCGSKISSKSLYLARFSRYKHFCVLQFLRKFRKFKMAAIFGETKISSKSLYLARFSRYKHFCVFLIWKIRND